MVPDWIETQGLMPYPDLQALLKTLWLLPRKGRPRRSLRRGGQRWMDQAAGGGMRTMHLMHHMTLEKVVVQRREGQNCCRTDISRALRHQKEGPLLRITERQTLQHTRRLIEMWRTTTSGALGHWWSCAVDQKGFHRG